MPGAHTLIVALAALQAFLVLINLAVLASIGAAFNIGGFWLVAIFVVLAFTFTPAMFFARKHRGWLVDWYYRASSYWLGLVLFLLAGGVFFYVVASMLYAANIYVPPAVIGAICFGAAFVIHSYGTWRSGRRDVTNIEVALPGLPSVWRGKRIVFISDLHFGCIRKERFAGSVAAQVRGLKPDLLLVGGDLYDGPACDEKGIIAPFRTLVADLPHGAYFVTGNHEYIMSEPGRALDAIRDAGIRILDNEAVSVDGLRIMGVDYQKTRRREDLKNVLGEIAGSSDPGDAAPAILLKHEPSDVDVVRDAGVSLGLFGHTHRGQVWPLSLIPRRIYHGFDYGQRSLGSLVTYTSSGAGTWGPPLRAGTRSEVVCITLR